jgi:hypothetical protein
MTYFGYFLMILGMLWALLAPGTRFRQLISKSAPVLIFFAILLSTISGFSQNAPIPDVSHSREFGKLLVQDKGGRVKPLSTLSSEVLRKLNRSTKFEGQSPEQVYLGMSAFPDYWQHTPIVKLKNNDLKAMLGVRGDMAAFVDFFDHQAGGAYKLSKLVQEAYALKPAQRSSLQKEVIKADEKVNILYMVFSGQMARIFPTPDNPKGQWLTMADAAEINDSSIVQSIASTYAEYLNGIRNAGNSVDLNVLNSKIKSLQDYQ